MRRFWLESNRVLLILRKGYDAAKTAAKTKASPIIGGSCHFPCLEDGSSPCHESVTMKRRANLRTIFIF